MNAKDMPPPAYTVVDLTSDSHDSFNNEEEHRPSAPSASRFNIEKASIEYKDEGTIEAETFTPFDRPLHIATENITSGSMFI